MKRRTNISLDEETYDKMKKLAADNHVSVSAWIAKQVWEASEKTEVASKIAKDIVEKVLMPADIIECAKKIALVER